MLGEMDPMEAMSNGGPIPKDFDAETAENMEDVRDIFRLCRRVRLSLND